MSNQLKLFCFHILQNYIFKIHNFSNFFCIQTFCNIEHLVDLLKKSMFIDNNIDIILHLKSIHFSIFIKIFSINLLIVSLKRIYSIKFHFNIVIDVLPIISLFRNFNSQIAYLTKPNSVFSCLCLINLYSDHNY